MPLAQVILYGSQSRGSVVFDSDIDLLVVVDVLDKCVYKTIVDEAFEVSLQFGVDLLAIPCIGKSMNYLYFEQITFTRT